MSIKELTIILISLYGVVSVSYFCHFITQKRIWKFTSPVLFIAGIFIHFIYLLILGSELGRMPIGNVYEVLATVTFLFAFVYLILEFYIKDKSMGVIIAPLVLVLQIIALTGIDTSKMLAPQLAGLTFKVHVVLMLLAYSGFTIAFIASIMLLLLAREIHQKRLGFFFSRIPSLELLDRLNSSAATLGFAFATIGMTWGFFMAIQLWGNPMPLDVKFISFFLTWCIYLFHLIARLQLNWRGERAAWLSVAGFTFVLLTLLVVSLFFTKMHLYR